MPRDFLEESYVPQTMKSQPRDFLLNEQDETIGQAAKLAPFRIGEDVAQAGYQALQNAPEYLETAKTEVPGFFNPVNFIGHPIERGKQSLAGLVELLHGVVNLPRNVADYSANRLNLIPKEWAENVPYIGDIQPALNELLGKPQRPGDKLSRGLVRNALAIAPTAKAASILNPLNLTAKNIAKDVLKTREKNISNYGQRYRNLWNEAEGKGFGDALSNVNIDIPTIGKYSPSKSIKGILDFDINPTLENAHAAKSDLLRIKRDLEKQTTLRTAERQQLKAVNEGIDSINKNMFKEPSGEINQSLVNKYQKIQEGYKNEVLPYKNKAIGEYMRGELSPDEFINSLSKKAFYAKRGKYHRALKIRKGIKNHPYLTGLGTGGVLGSIGTGIYNELFGSNSNKK
ncbi:TPA: hypothetical protein ACPSKL_000169 [Legionella anisa]